MATPGGGYDPAGGGPVLPGAPSGGGGNASFGLAPNVAATLCYVPPCCVNVVWAIYLVIVEKENKFVRFHAFQSLLFCGVAIAATIVVQIIGAISTLLSMLLGILVGVACLGALILLAIKAYGNEQFELPVIGALAKQWA